MGIVDAIDEDLTAGSNADRKNSTITSATNAAAGDYTKLQGHPDDNNLEDTEEFTKDTTAKNSTVVVGNPDDGAVAGVGEAPIVALEGEGRAPEGDGPPKETDNE